MRSPVRGSRRRAVTIAVACGLVIVLVAAAVFSIGSRSRMVVRHAADLHALNESLRSVTVVRSQVGFAAFLASVDERYRTDSRDVIRTAVLDARRGLADSRATIDATGNGSPLDEPRLERDVRAFADDAERVILLIEGGDAESARDATSALDASFERARDELVRRRDDQLDTLAADDDSLWRLGLLASFIVAFVVPAGIAMLYLGLTRRPRAQVHTELDALQRRRLRARSSAAAEAAIESLRDVIRRGDGGSALTTLDDLSVLLAVAHDGARQRFTDVPVRRLLDDVAAAARGPSGTPEVRCDDHLAWTDPDGLRHLMGNLIREAGEHGGRDLRLVCTEVTGHLQVAVAYRGPAPSPEVEEVLTTGAWDDMDPPPPHLLATVALAEGMGLRLGVLRDPAPAFVIQVESGTPIADNRPASARRAPERVR